VSRIRSHKAGGIIRALDPSDPRNPDHPSHEKKWLEMAVALGRLMADQDYDRLHKGERALPETAALYEDFRVTRRRIARSTTSSLHAKRWRNARAMPPHPKRSSPIAPNPAPACSSATASSTSSPTKAHRAPAHRLTLFSSDSAGRLCNSKRFLAGRYPRDWCRSQFSVGCLSALELFI